MVPAYTSKPLSHLHGKYSSYRMPVTHFVITGFGPFAGVKANPTQVLVEWLQQQDCAASVLASHPRHCLSNAAQQHGSYKIVSCTVLEVSANAVNEYLEQQATLLQDACRSADKHPVVLLHLGVDTQRNGLNLELQAYNNATFRCPDQCGWQPSGLVIEQMDGLGLNSIRCTTLPVQQLAQELHEAGFDCHLSQDAGRFVCNYIYHKSLQLTSGLQLPQQQLLAPPLAGTAAADAGQQQATSSSSSSTSFADTSTERLNEPGSGAGTAGSNGGSTDSGAGGDAVPAVATAAEACADTAVYSLFVHVPPFTAMSEDKQQQFMLALLGAIANWLNSR